MGNDRRHKGHILVSLSICCAMGNDRFPNGPISVSLCSVPWAMMGPPKGPILVYFSVCCAMGNGGGLPKGPILVYLSVCCVTGNDRLPKGPILVHLSVCCATGNDRLHNVPILVYLSVCCATGNDRLHIVPILVYLSVCCAMGNDRQPKGLLLVYLSVCCAMGNDGLPKKVPYLFFFLSYFLEPTDPLFVNISKAYMTEYQREFGLDHIYTADSFHQMVPSSGDTHYISRLGSGIYSGMLAADPQAIWLLSGFTFYSTPRFWYEDQVKALVTSVPPGHMIVLDMYAELNPLFQRYESFYGQPFIWVALQNFAGVTQMYGSLGQLNGGTFHARGWSGSTMIGMGMAPEGIRVNDVIFEFYVENLFAPYDRPIQYWVQDYLGRRYGPLCDYMVRVSQRLSRSVFNTTNNATVDLTTGSIVSSRPQLNPPLLPKLWYDPQDLFYAWDCMVNASSVYYNMDLYAHDTVTITQQAMTLISIKLYDDVINAYLKKDLKRLLSTSEDFLDFFDDLDTLLRTDRHYLLGTWLDGARALGLTLQERSHYEYNARMLITLWGPNGERADRSSRHWSGLVKAYYRERWQLFTLKLTEAIESGGSFDQSKFDQEVYTRIEYPFTLDTTIFPNTTLGNQLDMSRSMREKYFPLTKSMFFTRLWNVNRKRIQAGG
ncbi:unnamed protein product [Owenia fusiformis]|uniref:Alpha-N-acetylglucosaminidase n=1 Tax=Owenia fusiformis TaxID=6347 RepID=A0A8S4P2I7_OWEFU|nr:unnamed protein product [Owenia fusiformis]